MKSKLIFFFCVHSANFGIRRSVLFILLSDWTDISICFLIFCDCHTEPFLISIQHIKIIVSHIPSERIKRTFNISFFACIKLRTNVSEYQPENKEGNRESVGFFFFHFFRGISVHKVQNVRQQTKTWKRT